MKKRLWVLLAAVVLLGSAGIGFALAYQTETFSYDQIAGTGYSPPARAAHHISVLQEGDFPGMSDFPVTAEQAAPGRAAMNALRGQKYTRALPFRKPRNGGITIRKFIGCTPETIAYWDGKYLWLPKNGEESWHGYVPSDPDKLNEKLESICNTN